jgi:tRNA threonylcarbamoyl adenosine modification protein TsaD
MDLKDKENLTILAIESSCDETAAAVVKNGREVLSSVIASQTDIHQRFGGVVPEIASRNHTLALPNVVEKALFDAKMTYADIDAIAVTYGAGLLGALLTGVAYAKGLSYALGKPLAAVSHVRGHIAANYIAHADLEFPYICALASGGHTAVLEVKDYDEIRLLGTTKDDAAGEAFDKVARVLGLPYPGGPEIQKLAEEGRETISFTKTAAKNGYDFSFSGLKTAVINYIANKKIKDEKNGNDIEFKGINAEHNEKEEKNAELNDKKQDGKAEKNENYEKKNRENDENRENIGINDEKNADFKECRNAELNNKTKDEKNVELKTTERGGGAENIKFKDGITRADIAASFQAAAAAQIKDAAVKAAVDLGIKRIALSGGVGANKKLREELSAACGIKGIKTYFLPLWLCTDNAAMIGAEAYFMIRKGKPFADLELDAKATVGL